MPTLDRDTILQAVDLPVATVPVPRWGGEVRVRAMPMASAAYTNYKNRPVDKKGTPPSQEEYHQRRMLGAVILSAIDDEGNPLFRWADAEKLREKHWVSVLAIATKAFELAGDERGITSRVAELINDYGLDEVEAALDDLRRQLLEAEATEADSPAESDGSELDTAPEVADADPLPPTNGSSEPTTD